MIQNTLGWVYNPYTYATYTISIQLNVGIELNKSVTEASFIFVTWGGLFAGDFLSCPVPPAV